MVADRTDRKKRKTWGLALFLKNEAELALLYVLLDVLKEHQADWVHFGILDIRTIG